MTTDTCGTCEYFIGERCYRFPPAVINSTTRKRPQIEEDTIACGEWKKIK
jgi:hypothetical protein